MHHNRIVIPVLPLVLATASGCRDDTIKGYEADCEDDAIGWALDIANLVEVPPAEFGVECAGGWGHGVETRAASDVVELPNGFQEFVPHPQGGVLLSAYGVPSPDGLNSLWSERLGVEVATDSLAWLDDQAEEIRWLRDDLSYRRPLVVSTEAGIELWVWGDDTEQSYLSRIESGSGELLERVEWPEETMLGLISTVPAWPQDGGLWLTTLEGAEEDIQHHGLRRMSSFAELGPVLATFEAHPITLGGGTSDFLGMFVHPTPGGGVLWGNGWGTGTVIESVAEDGSLRWVLEEPHLFRVVDEHGGFLLGNVDEGSEFDQQYGFALQRRKLDDASLLWTRVHHRYEFVGEPEPDEWLIDMTWGYAARAEGGYLVAGGGAYPAKSCPQQPVIWDIDPNGEVEWAHRVETCGALLIPTQRVEGRALVLGFSYANGVDTYANIQAQWLQYFDL